MAIQVLSLPSAEARSGASRVSMRTGLIAGLGLFATLASGCEAFMQKPLCPKLDTCGGPLPIGTWELAAGYPSCSEDLYIPATDTRLVAADLPAARLPPPEPALFDWCILLQTRAGEEIQAKPPRFYYESAPIGTATVKFADNGIYSAGLARTGTYILDFPAFCMRAFGAVDDKPADPKENPDGPKVNVCKQLEVPLRASGIGEGSYRNTTCETNPRDPGGCLCAFDVAETGGPSGTFRQLNSNTLLHLSNSNFPQKVNYCTKGDTLELTGADGSYLFDVRGLRTMRLKKSEAQ